MASASSCLETQLAPRIFGIPDKKITMATRTMHVQRFEFRNWRRATWTHIYWTNSRLVLIYFHCFKKKNCPNNITITIAIDYLRVLVYQCDLISEMWAKSKHHQKNVIKCFLDYLFNLACILGSIIKSSLIIDEFYLKLSSPNSPNYSHPLHHAAPGRPVLLLHPKTPTAYSGLTLARIS